MLARRRFAPLRSWQAGAVALALAGCTGVVTAPPGAQSSAAGGSGASGSGVVPSGTAGTTGSSGNTGTAGLGVTGAAGTGQTVACSDATPDPGDAPLTRLTQEQYLNSIKDLFGNVD